MLRHVSSQLSFTADADARIVLAIAVADGHEVEEQWSATQDGAELDVTDLQDVHGTRLHAIDVAAGPVDISYRAKVTGQSAGQAVAAIDEVRYLRPSRYCESDTLAATAASEFSGLKGAELLASVSSWVGTRLAYVPGSSDPIDGAVSTLLARQGVCRDYAHLVVAMLRSLDVPARLAAVYAPGLEPMDFHAVAEAAIDGRWWVVDATTLAPRSTMVRIATGRDAADTALATSIGAPVALTHISVSAVADVLPDDDVRDLVQIR